MNLDSEVDLLVVRVYKGKIKSSSDVCFIRPQLLEVSLKHLLIEMLPISVDGYQ